VIAVDCSKVALSWAALRAVHPLVHAQLDDICLSSCLVEVVHGHRELHLHAPLLSARHVMMGCPLQCIQPVDASGCMWRTGVGAKGGGAGGGGA
jgi:hypothetical protein